MFELRQLGDAYDYTLTNMNNKGTSSSYDESNITLAFPTSIGSAENRKKVHEKVRKLFQKGIKTNKYHSASWIAWAKHEQRAGNTNAARKLLITGISNFPNSRNIGWFHCSLGNLARHERDFNTARACYDRALESTPPQKSLPVLLEYAQMEALYGLPSDARKIFEIAVERFPKEDRAWDNYLQFEMKISKHSGGGSGRKNDDSSSTIYITTLQQRRMKIASLASTNFKSYSTDSRKDSANIESTNNDDDDDGQITELGGIDDFENDNLFSSLESDNMSTNIAGVRQQKKAPPLRDNQDLDEALSYFLDDFTSNKIIN